MPPSRFADFLGQAAHVDDAVGVEMGVAVERHDHVRTGARLDAGGDARLQVVPLTFRG